MELDFKKLDLKDLLKFGCKIDKYIPFNSKFELTYSLIQEFCINKMLTRYITDFSIGFRQILFDNLHNTNEYLIFLFVRQTGINYLTYSFSQLQKYEDDYICNKKNLANLIEDIKLRLKHSERLFLIGFQNRDKTLFNFNNNNFFIQELPVNINFLDSLKPFNQHIETYNLKNWESYKIMINSPYE